MQKLTRSRKYKKRNIKKNKTRRNKKVRRVNRRKQRGGINHLGEVFLEIIKNQNEAGTNDEKIEQLKEQLRTAINDEVKFDKVMVLLDDYEYVKRNYENELEANKARDKKDSQGEYWAQNEYAKLIVELRDDYGIEIDY